MAGSVVTSKATNHVLKSFWCLEEGFLKISFAPHGKVFTQELRGFLWPVLHRLVS